MIVVGSGPAGVSAAWPLVEAGLRVLMVDASGTALPAPPRHASIARLRADPERWRLTSSPAGPQGASPKLATPLARAVLSGFLEASGIVGDGYRPVGTFAAGGLSRIWGALATPYGRADLERFPDRAGLAASEARVARRIGLSEPGGDPSRPPALGPPARRLVERHRARRRDDAVELLPASNAVLAQPRDGRDACSHCGLCLYGCARGAIYDSSLELPALLRRANFSYRPGMRVLRVAPAGALHRVEALQGGELRALRSGRVVLAAGTIATTGLALRRLGLQGRAVRLLSNPVGAAAFVVPGLLGAELPERSFALGQLSYSLAAGSGAEMFGVLYGADALPLTQVAERLPLTRNTALRVARALAPALLLASGYLPGRFSDNELVVEGDDATGRVRITGRQPAEAERLLRAGFRRLGRFARRRGAWPVPGSATVLPAGADAHPAGTLPMGGVGAAATDADGELRGCPGLHVADGASLPALSARHPTLTIMANADRIGRRIAARAAADGLRYAAAG